MGPTEGWAFLYLLMAAATMFIVNWIAKKIGEAADKKREAAAAQAAGAENPIQGDAYRTPGKVTPSRTLAIGNIPHDDDVWVIAYMRSGANGVAELLVATAINDGWIVAKDGKLERTAKQKT